MTFHKYMNTPPPIQEFNIKTMNKQLKKNLPKVRVKTNK